MSIAYKTTGDKIFGDEIIQLVIRQNELLEQLVASVRENTGVLRTSHALILQLGDDVRKIKFNTNV
jgi:hypothetical protein